MELWRRTDAWGGALCLAIGGLALALMGKLDMGNAAEMGPGFTPVWLARLLMGFGALIVVRAFFVADVVLIKLSVVRPLVAIIGGIVFFAVALPRIGFAATSFLLLLGSAAAGQGFRPREALVVAAVGALAATALFIWGLGLNIAVWPL